jgi:hypothetical protein
MTMNTIGGTDKDVLASIAQTSEGGYIIGGSSRSDSSADKSENHISGGIENWEDYWIVKLDTSGNIQWDNTIGGSYQDYLLSVDQTDDKGYILGGWSFSNVSGDKTENNSGWGPEYWIIKLSPDSLTYTSVPDLHPQELAIHAFPNPFSISVTISFTLDKSEKISIQIFDLNGRIVSTLANDVYDAGKYFIEWNARYVSSGIYILNIESENYFKTRKLTVER